MRQPGSTLCLRLWPSWRSALLPAGDLEMLRRGVLGLVHLSQYTVPCSERSVLGCLPATFLDEMRKKNLLEVQHLSICFWEVGLLELFLTPSLWLQRRIVFSRVRVWVESLGPLWQIGIRYVVLRLREVVLFMVLSCSAPSSPTSVAVNYFDPKIDSTYEPQVKVNSWPLNHHPNLTVMFRAVPCKI